MKKIFSALLAIVLIVSIGAFAVSAEDVKYGDTNTDGLINGHDCTFLMQYINGWNVTVDTAAADVNHNDKINVKDYVLLIRYLNGWDITLSPPQEDGGGIELPLDKWQ